MNPSAPSVGTEQWGNTSDERRVLGEGSPSQNERGGDAGDNQADLSRRTGASGRSTNTSHGGEDHTYRCADAGNSDCRWETSSDTEDELMQRVEEHWRQDHGLSDWTVALRNRVRDAVHRREAA